MRYDKYDGMCQRCEESGDCILVDDLWTCPSCITLQLSRLRGQLAEARAVIEKLEVRVDEPCDDCATVERDELRAVIERVREAQIHESVSGEALYCCSRCTRKILRGERFVIVGKAAVCVECFFRALLPAPATERGDSDAE